MKAYTQAAYIETIIYTETQPYTHKSKIYFKNLLTKIYFNWNKIYMLK